MIPSFNCLWLWFLLSIFEILKQKTQDKETPQLSIRQLAVMIDQRQEIQYLYNVCNLVIYARMQQKKTVQLWVVNLTIKNHTSICSATHGCGRSNFNKTSIKIMVIIVCQQTILTNIESQYKTKHDKILKYKEII